MCGHLWNSTFWSCLGTSCVKDARDLICCSSAAPFLFHAMITDQTHCGTWDVGCNSPIVLAIAHVWLNYSTCSLVALHENAGPFLSVLFYSNGLASPSPWRWSPVDSAHSEWPKVSAKDPKSLGFEQGWALHSAELQWTWLISPLSGDILSINGI